MNEEGTWTTVCEFRVDGVPKGQPRPRAFTRVINGRAVARVHDAGTAEGWKGSIALFASRHLPRSPLAGPLRVDLTFLMPRPQSRSRKCDPDGRMPFTAKPDRDNLDKAVLDCLTSLGMWGDDAQVIGGEVWKWYAAKGERPGAIVRVMRWQESSPAARTTATARPSAVRAARTGEPTLITATGLW